MRLDRLLANQPDFSRRQVRQLLAARHVTVNGQTLVCGEAEVSAFDHVAVDGRVIQAGKPALYLMLNKPAGYVSATRDPGHRTVIDLIDHPDRNDLHIAGRLDGNSTGLLVLTNDGLWSRRLTLPGSALGKTYRVETANDIAPACIEAFAAGLYFRFENLTTRPVALELLGPREARLTLHEGRYQQIKRMFGQFRNPVLAIHRERMGPLTLDPSLGPGEHRPLTAAEIAAV